MFAKHPEKDFTRERKLPFRKVASLLLSMEGGTLSTELRKHFGCSAATASASAFVQPRNKINADAFPSLFDLFVQKTNVPRYYNGLRLIAADGSEIQIPSTVRRNSQEQKCVDDLRPPCKSQVSVRQ